jgi:hypothetical protein
VTTSISVTASVDALTESVSCGIGYIPTGPGTSSAKASKGRPFTALETNKDTHKVLGAVIQAFRVVASLTINSHTYS